MQETASSFLWALSDEPITHVDRAVGLLLWYSQVDFSLSTSFDVLCQDMEAAGYARQNKSRLRRQLTADNRVRKQANDSFGLDLRRRSIVEDQFRKHLEIKHVPASDSVLPVILFQNTRGYIERVVTQINASFDTGLFDCTAVMCRRLLETLIIEVYESLGRADDLKDSDGHFKLFSGLLAILESDPSINLGRESIRGLKNFKKLGDQSAHNRRFNARRDDIVRIRDGLRLGTEELLNLAGLV